MASTRTDRVRMIALNYRRPGMSEADFHAHWRGEHFQIFSSMPIAQKNLLKYEQCHRNHAAMAQFSKTGFPMADFDGIAVFEAENYEKILECFTNQVYESVVVPDEEKFLDRKRTVILPCDLVTVFERLI